MSKSERDNLRLLACSVLDTQWSKRQIEQGITATLQDLGSTERIVIEHYYGIRGKGQKSASELSELLQITPGRIHQIRKDAINKMRSPAVLGWAARLL